MINYGYVWNDGTSLYHYGIPGMKWGVRRYQNLDGSYTEEGLKRYGRGTGRIRRSIQERRRAGREAYIKETKSDIKKKAEEREELYKIINDLDINGMDSPEFKDQLGKYIEDGYQVFWNNGQYANPDEGFDTAEEAYRAYITDVKDSIISNADSIRSMQNSIEVLKNAKLSDRTFVESEKLGRAAGITTGIATGAALTAASTMIFGIMGFVCTGGLIFIGSGLTGMKVKDKVDKLGVKKSNRRPKDTRTYEESESDFRKEYKKRFGREYVDRYRPYGTRY